MDACYEMTYFMDANLYDVTYTVFLVPCHTCDFVSRDFDARQSRARKSQVWHGTYGVVCAKWSVRPRVRVF